MNRVPDAVSVEPDRSSVQREAPRAIEPEHLQAARLELVDRIADFPGLGAAGHGRCELVNRRVESLFGEIKALEHVLGIDLHLEEGTKQLSRQVAERLRTHVSARPLALHA